MIEEKIAQAADALARKHLGMEVNDNDENNENNKKRRPDFFIQIASVFQDELTEQLNRISSSMELKYNLSKLSLETLEKIAEKIKNEAIDGNIKNLSTISQNKEILLVAERESMSQRRKEVLYSEENNRKKSLDSNEIIKPTKAEQAFYELGRIPNSLKRISEISKGVTLENIEQKRSEAKAIYNSEESKQERNKIQELQEEVLKNGNVEQKYCTLEEFKKNQITQKRREMTDEERKQTKVEINPILFKFIKSIYNSQNSSKEGFKKVLAEVQQYVLLETAFSDQEATEMLQLLEKCNSRENLANIIAQKMVDLSKERGIQEKNLDKRRIIHMAKTSMSKKDFREMSDETFARDVVSSKLYASIYLNSDERKRVQNLLKQLESGNEETEYDFDILKTIKNVDKEFYFSMIRNIGTYAEKKGSPVLKEKFNLLIQKEAEEERFELVNRNHIDSRRKLSPEQQKNSRDKVVGILCNFTKKILCSEKPLNQQKKEICEFIEGDFGFSEQEKIELLRQIDSSETNEMLSEVLFGKMNEIYTETTGKKLNSEELKRNLQNKPLVSKLKIINAKAAVAFEPRLQIRFEEFEKQIFEGIEANESYDRELLIMIRERDPEIYKTIMGYMGRVGANRSDMKLISLYNEFFEKDKEEYKETMENQQPKNDNETRQMKLFSPTNIKVDEVVTTHMSGDRLISNVERKTDDGLISNAKRETDDEPSL